MAVTKKLRFEVFKRDGFQCSYCGKSPPEVVLECDHITPKSAGGKDEINNLITACFDCNRGKSNISLDKAPQSLVDNLQVLKEKEEQLAEYQKLIRKIERRIQKDIEEINEVYSSYFPKHELSDKFKNASLKRFLKFLPVSEIKDAMSRACSIVPDRNDSIRYFCGICWRQIKGD